VTIQLCITWRLRYDFISDENRVCYNNDLEQTLTLLYSEWSKEIEPLGQSSTHHLLVVSSTIDKKGSEFMRRTEYAVGRAFDAKICI